jgi:hypothetical protein
MAIVAFYWVAGCFTIIAWLKAISHLCFGNFTRAASYFCIGCGLLFWWVGTDIDFDTWLGGSYVIVGMGVIASLLVYIKRHSRPTIPAPTTPADATGNIFLFINIEPGSSPPWHGATSTEQGPRGRISGPIIDHGG